MFRFDLSVVFLTALLLMLGLAGCGSNKGATVGLGPVPATVTLNPSPDVSLELGQNQAFTASMASATKQAITETVSYQSSNTSVATIAANGLACAGSWDNLTAPQICTPGQVGVALITATAHGVSSPPTAVYVHQHIDQVTIQPFTPANISPSTNPCQSVGQNLYYQAKAYSRGADITSTVGQFTWQALTTSVAKLSNTASVLGNIVNGLSLNQVQVTASVPGLTPIFATVGNATSIPATFTTCPVQSISVAVNGNSSNTLISSKGGGATALATVYDILGNQISPVPLTWSSSEPASVTAANGSLTSAIAGPAPGAATVVASCTPPTCNVGIFPARPIYPQNVVTMIVTPSTTESGSVYVSSTACGTIDNCFSTLVPLTISNNTLGTALTLPATPNSLVFSPQGTKAFLGTNSGLFGSVGLAVVSVSGSSSTVAQVKSAPGKVLAVSPDGNFVIVSDTTDVPNQLYVVNESTAAPIVAAYPITGATAADFSPDSLKAYIVAGSTLYVYSKLDALQTISLTAPAVDVSFLSEGAFAYLAGGSPDGVTLFATCDNAKSGTVPISPAPSFIKSVTGTVQLSSPPAPPSFRFVTLSSPDIDIINVNTQPQGCAPGVTNGPVYSFNLGQGNFVPTQLIVSEDGSTAYVIASNLSSILAFSIAGQVTTSIPLAGNAKPVQAALTPDGNVLYVAASDGTVHVVNTQAGGDVLQVTFPLGLCQNVAGQPFPGLTCNPDLIAVAP